ncbi:MAG: multidrug efflux RND transporter permease subunit [Candidatus Cybelea sp.]
MAHFFITRPIFAIVLSIVIVLLGGVAILVLPVAQFPPISPPLIQVQTTYIGASASVVEQSVASEIENEVVGVDNLIYMQSTSSSSGQYTLNCTFKVGADIQKALIDVQNRVVQATGKLPEAVNRFGITVQKKSPQILMVVALYSPTNSYDRLFLSNYTTLNLINPMLSVPGIGGENTIGDQDYAMRAWVRPDQLAKLGLEAGDLANAIDRQNVLIPTGAVGALPAPKNNQFQLSVNAQGRLTDPKQFGDIVVRSNPDGSILRLRDVSRVELGAQLYQTLGSINQKPATLVILYQTPDANALTTASAVRARLAELSKTFPPGLTYTVAYDSTLFVKDSIKDVLKTLVEALILVILVVFIFLGSFRSSFIPMLAVPVSLIGTFVAFLPLGFSINTLTLFGLVLAIGIVVDDAIVVVEGVEHHIESGMEPLAATERAMKELTAPILGISLVLTSVFLPSAFISGIVGQLYRQFALTITISVNISALVALTLTPALCVLILRKRTRMWGPLGWFIDKFNGIFASVTSGYMGTLRWLMRRTILVLALLGGFYLITALVGSRLPGGFVPDEDQGVVYAQVQLPYGSSLDRNAALLGKMEKDLTTIHGVENVIALAGYSLLTSIQTPDASSFIIVLQPWDERVKEHITLRGIVKEIDDKMNAYPEAASFPFVPPTIPGLGNASGFAFELQDTGGHTIPELAAIADKVVVEARKRPELTAMNNTMRTSIPLLQLDVDRDRAAQRGVAVSDVFQQLQAMLGGLVVSEFTYFNRTWDVMVQAEPEFRANANSIGSIYVRNGSNEMVPIKTVTTVRPSIGTDFIQRFNTNREIEIFGSNAPGYSTGQAIAAMSEVAKKTIPAGYTYGWSGTAYQEVSVGNTQTIIFVFSVVLVFLALAAQYESWLQPLAVLLAVPTGVLGAFLSVLLWRLDNNVYVQIGIIMIIGLAAKNAVLIVEFARERRAHGASIHEAATDAARLRFRPILMTSFAFIIGVVPLMFAHGAGAASRQSLGSTVFAGMLAATALGIFFTPTLYEVFQHLAERGKKKEPAPQPEEEPA